MPQRTFYGTCSTASGTSVKSIACTDFTDQDLVSGTSLLVKFTNSNSASSTSFKINNGTQKDVKWNEGVDLFRNSWTSGQVVQFVYDGSVWLATSTPMTILTYGSSTWTDFLNAYNRNALVYCAVDVSGDSKRMAFMAYHNRLSDSSAYVEFQYLRSVSTKTTTDQGDETIIYKL